MMFSKVLGIFIIILSIVTVLVRVRSEQPFRPQPHLANTGFKSNYYLIEHYV